MKAYCLSELATVLAQKRKRIVVLCHGCFDFLHVGHVRHLEEAKAMGEILIVSVTADPFVNKGDNRPIFDALERAEMLCALACVDYVVINHAQLPIPVINALKPDIYVKGADYVNTTCPELDAVVQNGGKMLFTETKKYSTTHLIERMRA